MIKIKTFDSIKDVPKEHWDSILKNNNSCTYSYAFWQIMEQSKLNDFSYHYALFYDVNENPIGLTSFYTITTDIAIFSPRKLKYLLQFIRQTFPNFLKFKMLECGTPITLNQPLIVSEASNYDAVIKSLNDLLLSTAKNQGHFLIVVRDFEPDVHSIESNFKAAGYHIVDSLPTTYMNILWESTNEYLASMKSYYRCKLLKHLQINETQGTRHELREDFDDLSEILCNQWHVVHNHASEYQREVLTAEFYKEFSIKMGAHSKVLLFYRNGALVGHALLLMDNELLRWLYFGRNEALNDSLYIYVADKVIETAILLGAKKLELGLTTYAIKKDLGAYLSPIKLALRSPLWLIDRHISLFYPLLNHVPEINNKIIFKNH